MSTALSAQQRNPAGDIVDSARHEIDAANATGDVARLDHVVAYLERAAVAYPNDGWISHYLGFAYFRTANVARGTGDAKRLKTMLELADKTLEKSEVRMELAETRALRSAVLGQMIGQSKNPFTGMRLGPKADKELDKALAMAPTNPRVWAIRASAFLYKPKLFGGSMEKAEEYARRAIELVSNDHPTGFAPTWGESDAYLFLGQALFAQKKYADAKAAYDRVLALEPGNGYVIHVLMPALKKQLGG